MHWQRLHVLRNALVRLLTVAITIVVSASAPAEENWPRFRGANGSGVSNANGLPRTWSPEDYAFNIELPGEGHSCPVIWDDRLFVTSAVDEGKLRYTICLDARTGNQVWIRESKFNSNRKHAKSSWASATPATDGERVYVAFADKESYVITAYDFAGNVSWSRDLGPYDSQHGQGASPIVAGDLVIAPNDQDGPSSIIALNRVTGDTVWSTPRSGKLVSYATPLVIQKPGGPLQLICSSSNGISSLDPGDGRINWMTAALPARTVASPVFDGSRIIQQSGSGGGGALLLAIDPFDVDAKGVPRTVFERKKNLPYVPTPIAYQDHLYLWNDNGVVNCVESASGDNVWTKRIGGNYTGSPICVGGALYVMSEDGRVVVLAASPTYEKFGDVPLNDPSHSTPSFADGRLYLRTFHRLFCLATKP